jgi:hypothetical protein
MKTNKELTINTAKGHIPDYTTFPEDTPVMLIKGAYGGKEDGYAIINPKKYASEFSHHDLTYHYVWVKEEDIDFEA